MSYPLAVDQVKKIYRRHASEFGERMTSTVLVNTDGGPQQVRLFSLRGANLLGMLARTKKAAEFRSWILDVLERVAADAFARAERLEGVERKYKLLLEEGDQRYATNKKESRDSFGLRYNVSVLKPFVDAFLVDDPTSCVRLIIFQAAFNEWCRSRDELTSWDMADALKEIGRGYPDPRNAFWYGLKFSDEVLQRKLEHKRELDLLKREAALRRSRDNKSRSKRLLSL